LFPPRIVRTSTGGVCDATGAVMPDELKLIEKVQSVVTDGSDVF
jgi:hypothetical protein